jgi:UDP-glucose 4-epimerase
LSVGRISNLNSILENKRFEFIQSDVTNLNVLKASFREIDWVFHLAGLADIVPSIENPDSYFNTNVVGSYNVAKLAREFGITKVIYAASSSCYGIPETYPTTELNKCDPKYPYALTKYLGEQILIHWALTYNIPVVSLRLFNVFGPRSRTNGTYGAVFGIFLAQKLAGKPFTVVGDGTQTRDFTFVNDVCCAFLEAAKSSLTCEIFNVGSGSTYQVNELVKILGGDVTYIPKRPAEPDCTFADITKIKTYLNWTPKISLKEGIAVMLKDINYWKDAPLWDSAKIAEATASWFHYLGPSGKKKVVNDE